MRKSGRFVCFFLLMSLATVAFSGGPDLPTGVYRARYSIAVQPGSLKNNIERISAACGWSQVVWNVPNDYQWVGKVTLRGDDLPSLLSQLLKNYPVQAVLYKGNHIVAVSPRTLR